MATSQDMHPSPRRDSGRTLILTAPIGGGHTAVATALASMLRAEGAEAEIVSPLAGAGWLSRLPALYGRLATQHPSVWAIYYYARRIRSIRKLNRWVVRKRLVAALNATNFDGFDVIVLTHSIYCHGIPELRRQGVRINVLVTDLFGGPLEWFQPGADHYIVPTNEMLTAALAEGVQRDLISIRRLPNLAHQIIDETSDSEASASPAFSRILLIGGSEGAGPVKMIAKTLSRFKSSFSLTVACGHNEFLQKKLSSICDPRIRVTGYVDELWKVIPEYELVITKPGSATLIELLTAAVPFLLMPGIAGIERGNTAKISKYTRLPALRRRRDVHQVLAMIVGDQSSTKLWRSKILEGLSQLNNELPSQLVSQVDFYEGTGRAS